MDGRGRGSGGVRYYQNLALYYDASGHLSQAEWGRWDEPQPWSGDYEKLARRYFYYDSPTELFATETYLYDQDYRPTRATCSAAALELTDYVGSQPYGEYTLHADEPVSSCDAYTAYTLEDTRHLPAAGTQGVQQLSRTGDPNAPTYSVAQTRFLHGDMIRSTMLTTDPNASDPNLIPQSRITYTAFGEPIVCGAGGGGGGGGDPCGTGTLAGGCQDWTIGGDLPGAPEDPNCATFGVPPLPRYGYAGGFGYQSGRTKTRYAARYGAVAGSDPNLPGADAPYSDLLTLKGANPALPAISLQHLGHRWYDPAIGRFLQRDPIGLAGGLNAYLYVGARPSASVDPSGLMDEYAWDRYYDRMAEDVATGKMSFPEYIRLLKIQGYCGLVAAGMGAAIASPIFFGGAATAAGAGVTVTRWGGPLERAGQWVMLGGPTWLNYILSGKYQPGLTNTFAWPTDWYTYCVSRTSLMSPILWNPRDPFNWVKWLIGQRVFVGG